MYSCTAGTWRSRGGRRSKREDAEQPSWNSRSARKTLQMMFAQLDLDGDGQLSMEEFHAGFAAKSREWGYEGSMEAADSAEMEMFRAMDADSSGYISYDEFKSYMDSLTDSLLQENKDIANEKYKVARENDRARDRAEAMEYSMKANENYEVADPASEDGVYTRYNKAAVVVANAGTQKDIREPKSYQVRQHGDLNG